MNAMTTGIVTMTTMTGSIDATGTMTMAMTLTTGIVTVTTGTGDVIKTGIVAVTTDNVHPAVTGITDAWQKKSVYR